VGGIFFLHFGILSAMMFYNISAIAGISNALLPLLNHQKKPLLPHFKQETTKV
jgi:hypothetical protein